MSLSRVITLVVITILPWPLYASRQVLIFGGGPKPNASQVSIELNTLWISDIINKHYPQQSIYTLYTDGNKTGVDVHRRRLSENDREIYQPIARVFNKYRKNGFNYTSSHITEDTSSSDAENVTTTLANLFSTTKPKDDVLVIYQGHGGYNSASTSKNYFRLWGESKLTVVELEELMNKADPQARVRFVLPQCFSGAFSKLIYKGANVKNGLAKGMRCGFLAQREDRESEGCTDSVNTDHYRDYSYYFFSALDGKKINGDPLTKNPDKNNDGIVTLREAHLYTLANAFSIDFSRSTSEDYLENWQPWYLKWVPVNPGPDNVYNEVAKEIAARFNILNDATISIPTVKKKINSLNQKLNGLEQEQKKIKKDIENIQKEIQLQLAMQWPAIEIPYTIQYRKIMLEDIDDIQAEILEHQRYAELVKYQESLLMLEEKILNSKRELVQMEKIFRMNKIARILAQFHNYANEQEKEEYDKLLQCENTRL